jgi:hypothetical protein
MSEDRIGRLARRAEGDPHFLASALAGLDDAELAERLGCAAGAIPHLKLCRRPDPASVGFLDDVRAIAARFGLRPEALAELCRRYEPPAGAELHVRRTPGDGASATDRPAARYVGRRGAQGARVEREAEDGAREPLPPRTDLRNHSPTGFEWGYGGSGPAQLALAILADALGPTRAVGLYHDFKWEVLAGLEADEWAIAREDVLAWLSRRERGA